MRVGNALPAVVIDYLVVAGGGGGGGSSNTGYYAAGGGAGGLRSTVTATGGGGTLETALTLSTGTNYTVTVGGGGTAGAATTADPVVPLESRISCDVRSMAHLPRSRRSCYNEKERQK